MKMSNRYAKHKHKFSFGLMVPSHAYVKFTQPLRGSERQYFFAASVKTCRKLGLSVTPNVPVFKDRAIDSMQSLNSLGDKTKYFIEFSHQYGAHHDSYTQVPRGHKKKHEYQPKDDCISSHPKVHELKVNRMGKVSYIQKNMQPMEG